MDILASCGMDKSSVSATSAPGHLPEFCGICMGNILECASKISGIDQVKERRGNHVPGFFSEEMLLTNSGFLNNLPIVCLPHFLPTTSTYEWMKHIFDRTYCINFLSLWYFLVHKLDSSQSIWDGQDPGYLCWSSYILLLHLSLSLSIYIYIHACIRLIWVGNEFFFVVMMIPLCLGTETGKRPFLEALSFEHFQPWNMIVKKFDRGVLRRPIQTG